jgi:dihydroxy-acid dehydratase
MERAFNTPPIQDFQTPWQEIYRAAVGELHKGACMELALPYRGVG